MKPNTYSNAFSLNQIFLTKDFSLTYKPFHQPFQQDNSHLIEQHHLESSQTFLKSLLKLGNLPYYNTPKQTLNSFLLALSNSSPPVQTSNSTSLTSAKQKGFNISLKDNYNELSQISANAETSLNNNIHRNCGFALQSRVNPHTQLNPSLNEVKRNC